MRVLHITPGLDERIGGPSRVARGLCGALAKQGVEVTLFTSDFNYDGCTESMSGPQPPGVQISFFPIQHPRWYIYSPELARALERRCREFDLLHIHGLWLYPTAVGGRVARKYRVPYIIRPRGNLQPYALKQKSLKKKIYGWLWERRNLNHAAALQFANREELEEAKGFGFRSPAFILPNGVDQVTEDQIAELRGSFRRRYPELADKKIILFVGRINPVKGLERLVGALRQVVLEIPEARLVLAGPDVQGFSQEVRRWINHAGVGGEVLFTGHLAHQDVLAACIDADVFCLCSYQEGHSSALNEALMCGLPAVATPEVKFRDLEEHSAGLRAEGDPAKIAAALLTLLRDETLRREMGIRARKLMLEKYTWDKLAGEMIKIYESLLRDRTVRA